MGWACCLGLVLVLGGSLAEASWLDPAPTVKKMYSDLLGRVPSDKELEGKIGPVLERKKHLLDVLRGFYQSQEFATRCHDKKLDFVEAAYLSNLGRPADGEGHEHYLDLLRDGKLTEPGLCDELANSEEGRVFAIRQLYFEILYRDLDEVGRGNYLEAIKNKTIKGTLPLAVDLLVPGEEPATPDRPAGTGEAINAKAGADRQAREKSLAAAEKAEAGKLAAEAKARKTKGWVPRFNEAGRALPEVANALQGSFERRRFTEHYQQAKEIITKAYRDILGREPDGPGFRHYLRAWAVGEMHLTGIWDELLNCEEFKKRKHDEIEIAFLRHLLRPADKGGLATYRREVKGGRPLADIRQDLKCSNEGICAALRRAYWEILNRDVDQGGRQTYEPHLQASNKPAAYKQVCIDLLDSGEAKDLRRMCAEWRQIRDGQEKLIGDDGVAMLDFLGQIDGKLADEVKKAAAQFKELEKTLPAEFASLTFALEDALKGADLKKMKAAVARLIEEVKNLGPLLTAEVQKVFVELLGQPAPDFYGAYNAAQPAWEGDKQVGAAPGSAPKTAGVPGIPSGATPSTGPVAELPPMIARPAIPSLPGFETSQVPADLLAKAQQLMAGLKPGPQAAQQLQEGLTKLIVGHPFFKKLEPQRQELVVSVFQGLLRRPPTEEEITTWLKKLESGQVTLDSLRAELEKNPEFALIDDLLKTGRIVPFKDDEKKKAEEEGKAADGPIKDEQVKLSDLEGFNTFDFANEVVIAKAVKTQDANGFCITGTAQLPSRGVTVPVKVFAKQHPSVYGYRSYIVGFFLDTPWKSSSAYVNPPAALKDFLPALQLDKGALLFTTVDAVVQPEALPDQTRADFAALLGDTGHKGMRLTAGLNLLGHLNLSMGNGTKHLGKLLGGGVKSILIQGHLATDPAKLYLRALLPAFGKDIFPGSMTPAGSEVEFTGKPSVAVQTRVGFKLPKDQAVEARLRFEVPIAPTGTLQMVAALDGLWKDAFGLKGLTIGNLILSGKITVPAMAPAFGLAGDFRFGDKVVRIAASIPASPNLASLGFRGSINALGTEDLVALMHEMGMEIGSLPFPAELMGLKDVEVSVAGQADPTLKIPAGTTCRAKLCLKSEVVAAADVQVNQDVGIQIKGSAKKIELGPVLLSGNGPDGKPNTADDGAIVEISVPALVKVIGHASFSGRATIFNVGRDVTMWIDRRGLGFSDGFKIFDAFTSKVEVQGDLDARSPNFNAKVEIQADLAGRLARKVDELTGGKTPNFVRRIFKNIFNLRRAGFEGNLARTIKGDVPRFWIEFGVMGRVFDLNLSLNLSRPEDAVRALAGEAAGRVTQRVKAFVVEYLRAIANFFKSLFGKRKGSIDDIINRFRNTPPERHNSRSAWDTEGNRFGAYYDRQ
jgi:hypothetical protein